MKNKKLIIKQKCSKLIEKNFAFLVISSKLNLIKNEFICYILNLTSNIGYKLYRNLFKF
jgi:TRAP-type mannitol/chloroaromatic compound transport system permease small subunit